VAESPQESPAHSLSVGETGRLGNDVDWLATLFKHDAGRFDPKVLYRFCRRSSCFDSERPAELSWT
jgi:hypothetical protein